MNPEVLDAIYGMPRPGHMGGAQGQGGPEYLQTSQRSSMSRISLNTGSAYLAGAGLGGLFGAVNGFRSTDSRIAKIRLNGVVNGIEGGVARAGNALGVLALTYSLIDAVADGVGVRQKLPLGEYADDIMPVASATLTGFIYKITSSPKQAILAAALGGSAMGAYRLVQDYLPRNVLRTIKEAAF